LLVLCLSLILMGGEPEWLAVDEINVRILGPSAQNGPLVLISNFGLHNSSLTLFDFRKGKAKILDDGRLRVLMVRPVPFQKGFAVIGAITEVLYFLDETGEFLSQNLFRDIPGWEEDFRIKQISSGPDNTVYLSLSLNRAKELALAVLDLDKLEMALLCNRPAHESHSQAWLANLEKLFFFDAHTGQIDLVDPHSFELVKTLRNGAEPFKKPNPRPRRSEFKALLESPIISEGRIYFRRHRYRDDFGNKLPTSTTNTLVLGEGGIWECDLLPYGTFQGRSLVFDWREGEFRLLETSDACAK